VLFVLIESHISCDVGFSMKKYTENLPAGSSEKIFTQLGVLDTLQASSAVFGLISLINGSFEGKIVSG
jgi:hypothetical protein